MALKETLNEKVLNIPLWVWGLVATFGGAFILIRKRNAAAANNSQSDQSAANQTNADLGSASTLADMFEVAGLMPYQGGDVYVNTTGNTTNINPPPPPKPPVKKPPKGKPPRGGRPRPGPTRSPYPPPKKVTTGSPQPHVKTYTVQPGDTMIGIASKQFGLPANEQGADTLYYYGNNAAEIRGEAEKHGITSDFVHWIYPGEQVSYPG